jgi:hypothetical protein
MVLSAACLLAVSVVAPRVSALHNAAWVDARVKWVANTDGTAKPAVINWENECTTEFNANNASMPHGNDAQKREVVNASAYNQTVWLTRAGDPRDLVTTPVLAGTAVDMQINKLLFLCAIITMNPTNYAIHTDHKVTNTQYPNDRAPVPDSNAAKYDVNQASRYESNSKIYGLTVISGPGSIGGTAVGKVSGYDRDNNSRYWQAPAVPFKYNVPPGLAPGTYNITVELDYATIQTYHDYGAAGTSRCIKKSTGDGANVPYGRYDLCEHDQTPYSFKLTIVAPTPAATVRPSSAVDKPQVSSPDVATFTHSVALSSGSLTGASLNYSVQRFRNGVAVGGPQTGVYVYSPGMYVIKINQYTPTGADAGATICEQLTLTNVPGGTIAITNNPSEVCTVVAFQPYLKVFGGDISAGNGLATTPGVCTANNSAAVISWNAEGASFNGAGAQFATYALSRITDFATAQGNAGGAPVPSGLAFSNAAPPTVPSGSDFGGSFASVPCIPNYYNDIPSAPTPLPGSNVSTFTTHDYSASGAVTLDGGTINPHNRIRVFVTGNVYIRNNITYAGNWDVNNMPLFELVVKGNIYIDPAVSQLDGIYIAQKSGANTGLISTCATAAGSLSLSGGAFYAPCNRKLTINGVFTADQIQFMRTKGTFADSASDNAQNGTSNAAEQFNFNPTLWIAQPVAQPGSGTVGNYDAITSLPPVL